MANVTITQLPQAGAILGTEAVPIVQNGQTVQTTTAAIAGSPTQTYQYLTVIQTPNLPNSRYLGAGAGLLLTDSGAQSTYTISLDSTLSSFNSALAGVMVKTDSSTVTNRFMQASGAGITVTNGDGVSGNPTYSLTGNVLSLANCSGNGMLTFINGIGVQPVTIQGTASEIDVTNGTGVSGNPTIGLADDPVLPGTGAVQVPGGTTAQRPGPVAGKLRFNSDTGFMEYYTGAAWANLSAGSTLASSIGGGLANQILFQSAPSSTSFIAAPTVANTFLEWSGSAFQWSTNPLGTVTSVDASGGTTGLSFTGGPITTSGTLTMSGTLITSNGGTGLTSYTVGDLPYYASGTALSKLAIGTSTQILTSSGAAPQWTNPTTIAVGTATNVAGGSANQIVYNTSAGATSFVVAPTVANTFLEWSGSAFQWSANPLGTVTSVAVSGGTTGLTTSGGPITTSGTITLAGTLAVANGGTGQTTAAAAFDALAPTTTQGDIIFRNATVNTRLAIGGANTVLASTGSAPNWVSDVSLGTVTASTKLVSPHLDAASSAGGQLRNATGTSQLAWGAGGGSNLSLEVATNINPANANVSIAPTGTGTLTINPATAGTMNNVAIGGTTAAAVTGTTITANTQFSGAGTGLTGTATSLSIGGNAATATSVATTATSVNATFYLGFVDATTGNNGIEVDTDLTYNPSTNILTVPNLVATSGISGGTF